MDGVNFSELGAVMNVLKDNPQLVQMLSGMLASQPPKTETKKEARESDAIASLLGLLNGSGGANERTQKSPNEADSSKLSSVFGSREEIKNRIILLQAVRPYLSETRKERLEAVIKLLRLAELGNLSSLLG